MRQGKFWDINTVTIKSLVSVCFTSSILIFKMSFIALIAICIALLVLVLVLVLELGVRFAPDNVIVNVGFDMLENVFDMLDSDSYFADDRIEREFGNYCATYPVFLALKMSTTNLTFIEATLFFFLLPFAVFVIIKPLWTLCLLATGYHDMRYIEGRLANTNSASEKLAWGVSLMLYKELIHNRRASREYNNIPSVDFHQDVGRGDLTCSMCLEDFIEGETVKRMDICEHIFHPECIYTWVHVHCSCPMCRRMV